MNIIGKCLVLLELFLLVAYRKALERREHDDRLTGEDCFDAATLHDVDTAMDPPTRSEGPFRAEPTSVLGVAALLEALAYNDEGDSPIEMYINRAWEP
jgi:hypothetical protein